MILDNVIDEQIIYFIWSQKYINQDWIIVITINSHDPVALTSSHQPRPLPGARAGQHMGPNE